MAVFILMNTTELIFKNERTHKCVRQGENGYLQQISLDTSQLALLSYQNHQANDNTSHDSAVIHHPSIIGGCSR